MSKRVVHYSEQNTNSTTCLSSFLSRDNSLISFHSLGDEYQNDSSVLYLYANSNFDGIPLRITAQNTLYINTTYKSYFFMGSTHKWFLYGSPNYKGQVHKLIPSHNVTKRKWGFTLETRNESIRIQSIRRLPNSSYRTQPSYLVFTFISYLLITPVLIN